MSVITDVEFSNYARLGHRPCRGSGLIPTETGTRVCACALEAFMEHNAGGFTFENGKMVWLPVQTDELKVAGKRVVVVATALVTLLLLAAAWSFGIALWWVTHAVSP